MYAVGTLEMARTMGLDFLRPLTDVMFWASLVAWVALFSGQLHALWRRGRVAPAN